MNESYLTMLDYEKVLENVAKILPRIHGGNVRSSMHGGAHLVDEEVKEGHPFSINQVTRDSRQMESQPLMEGSGDVSIAHVAGTIEVDEKVRLKKLIFRATRGKALTFF